MTPKEFQTFVNWPGVRPNACAGGGFYGVEDDGGGSSEGAFDQNDPTRIHSANTTQSDDGDGGSDYMHDWEGKEKTWKLTIHWVISF